MPERYSSTFYWMRARKRANRLKNSHHCQTSFISNRNLLRPPWPLKILVHIRYLVPDSVTSTRTYLMFVHAGLCRLNTACAHPISRDNVDHRRRCTPLTIRANSASKYFTMNSGHIKHRMLEGCVAVYLLNVITWYLLALMCLSFIQDYEKVTFFPHRDVLRR